MQFNKNKIINSPATQRNNTFHNTVIITQNRGAIIRYSQYHCDCLHRKVAYSGLRLSL